MNPLNPLKILAAVAVPLAIVALLAVVRAGGPRQASGEKPARQLREPAAVDTSMPLQPAITLRQFQQQMRETRGPVLVYFTASWCRYCRQQTPVLESLAREYQNRARFLQVDIDVAPELAGAYNITGVPAVLIFQGGQLRSTLTGYRPAADFRDVLDSLLRNSARPHLPVEGTLPPLTAGRPAGIMPATDAKGLTA